MAVDTRDFYKLRWVYYHCDAKPIQILLSMYDVQYRDTTKNGFLPHLSVPKRGYALKRVLAEVIQSPLNNLKTGCQYQFTSSLPWRRLRRPWAASPTTARAGCSKRTCFPRHCHACSYGTIIFCPVFSKKFNIMSALFVHQPLTLPQKIDSREGLFRCKKGLASECGKMNINSKRPPLAPLLGLFGAKYSAICC